MTRQEFIENHWQAYPRVPGRIQGPSIWLWGRLHSFNKQYIKLDQGLSEFILAADIDSDADPYLGMPIPQSLLLKNDIIALKLNKEKQVVGLFLLSPCLGAAVPEVDREWIYFLEQIKSFFVQKGFKEWRTANLLAAPGVDAHIDFMKVQGVRTKQEWYLPTSPEIELKKAIAAGERRIFEVKSVFRDDDLSPHHNPEFTMLEWYRTYQDKWNLLNDIYELIQSFDLSLSGEIQRVSMAHLFEKYVGMNLSPQTSQQELVDQLKSKNLNFSSDDDWDDLFFRLFVNCIEPNLIKEGAIAIYNYPASQSSLSRLTSDGWSDRFEFYWQGVEIANAYQEENNPATVEAKINQEINKRKSLGRETFAVDKKFIEAYQCGFPPCCGVALGLERLFMLLMGKKNIQS